MRGSENTMCRRADTSSSFNLGSIHVKGLTVILVLARTSNGTKFFALEQGRKKKKIAGEGPKHGAGRVVIRFIFPLAEQLTASASNTPAQVSFHGEPQKRIKEWFAARPLPKTGQVIDIFSFSSLSAIPARQLNGGRTECGVGLCSRSSFTL